MNLKRASIIATTVLVAAILAMLFRQSLFANRPVTLVPQVAAALLLLWSRLTFGMRSFHGPANPTAGGLVTTGPYRWLRHPIYASILLFTWAAVASHPGVVNAMLALVATVATAVRIVAEERLVILLYPEYAAYSARTKRLIPFVF